MSRLLKQRFKHKELKSLEELELELKKFLCPNCPIARWRFAAAQRGLDLFCGVQWEGRQHSGYGIWMYPPGTPGSSQRSAKYLVAEAPSLKDLCGCKR